MRQREREVSLSLSRKREVTAGEPQSKRYQEEPERDCGSDRRDARGDEVGLLEELSRAAHTHTHTHTLPKAQDTQGRRRG